MTKIHDLSQHGQAIWVDYIRRSFTNSGGLQGLIDQGTNKLISYYKVLPNGEQRQPLFVINHVSKGEVFASVNSFKILASLGTLL